MDMTEDVYAQKTYGKLALIKMAPVPDTFRLFSAGWQGEAGKNWEVMKVTGADFRVAKAGPNKGKLAIRVKGSDRTAYVTRMEIQDFEEKMKLAHARYGLAKRVTATSNS